MRRCKPPSARRLPARLCHALVAAGQRSDAEMLLDELNNLAAKQYVKPYFMAMSGVAPGKFDEAFEWFEKGLEERDQWFIRLGTEPKLDALRQDPRFLELFRKTKNPLSISDLRFGISDLPTHL